MNAGKILIPIGFLLSLFFLNSGGALLLGVLIALSVGNPFIDKTRRLTKPMLAWSIVGLGAGMNFLLVLRAGADGVMYTLVSLILIMLLGFWLGRLYKTSREMSTLVNVGTAICGGSAIAAVSSAINAKDESISVSMGIVFILNALALFIFPTMGHWLNLSSEQFGLWAALAIHDTSSVVGATMQYSQKALEIGSTIKLARALWIIPAAFFFAKFYKKDDGTGKKTSITIPWFIAGFVVMSALVSSFAVLQPAGHQIEWLAKRTLVATLFLIGSGLTMATIKKVGLKTFLHGFTLWIIVVLASLKFATS
jgi:uncharacterized integral membrane protein (TIGR00698 family)